MIWSYKDTCAYVRLCKLLVLIVSDFSLQRKKKSIVSVKFSGYLFDDPLTKYTLDNIMTITMNS